MLLISHSNTLMTLLLFSPGGDDDSNQTEPESIIRKEGIQRRREPRMRFKKFATNSSRGHRKTPPERTDQVTQQGEAAW
jgi:hypothetical protein